MMDLEDYETQSFIADDRVKRFDEKKNHEYSSSQWKCSSLVIVVVLLMLSSNLYLLNRLRLSTPTKDIVPTTNNGTTIAPVAAPLCEYGTEMPTYYNDTLPDYNWTDDHPSGIDRSWCPKAVCRNSPICKPCQRRFLMVITNGRSASTTLTWMLDLLPGVRMAGENNNAIQRIKDMMDSIFSIEPMQVDTSHMADHHGAWYHNPIPPGALGCVSQHMIETIVPPVMLNSTHVVPRAATEIIGFKTIRLIPQASMDKIPDIVAFLKDHFPCTRYIVNHRSDVEEQAESQIKVFQHKKNNVNDLVDSKISQLEYEFNRLSKFAELMGRDQAMIIDSSNWTEHVGELNKAVRWLGFSHCEFDKVLELNTKNGYGATGPSKIKLNSQCRYVGSKGN